MEDNAVSDIRQWLEGHGLGHYADAFEANEIDLDLVRDLDDDALEKLGVSVMGHRVRLLRAIAALGGKDERPGIETAQPVAAHRRGVKGFAPRRDGHDLGARGVNRRAPAS